VGNVGSRFKHEVPTSGGRAQGSRITDVSCRLLFHQFPTEHVTREHDIAATTQTLTRYL